MAFHGSIINIDINMLEIGTVSLADKLDIIEIEDKLMLIIKVKSNINYLTFNNKGNTNKFGSIFLSVDNELFKLIFHIEKGRLRYEKQKH